MCADVSLINCVVNAGIAHSCDVSLHPVRERHQTHSGNSVNSQSVFKIFAHVQDTYHQIPIIYTSRFNPLPIKVKIKIKCSRLYIYTAGY